MIDANKILEIAADLIAGHALVVMGRNYAYEPSTISDLTWKTMFFSMKMAIKYRKMRKK